MNVSVFLVLYFILIKQNVASHVLPVENVTLLCHNLQTVVYWNHSQPQLQPRFTVTLQSYYDGTRTQVCTDTPAYYCNVSAATQGIIRDDYIVFVSVSGQSESEPAAYVTFSYDRSSSSSQICSVDLPSVNVSAEPDHQLKVHFLHPFQIYKNAINQSDWESYEIFSYVIITEDQKEHGFSCHIQDQACEATLPAEMAADKHCVNIRGSMDALTVTTPEVICIDEPPPAKYSSHIILYIILSVVIILAICCGLYIVFRKWTQLPLPRSITKMLKGVNSYPLLVEVTNISPVSEGSPLDGCRQLLLAATPTANPHPADSDPHPADSDPHPADSDPHPADSDPHPAHTDPHPAHSDPHPAHTYPHPAHTDPHPADSNPHPAYSDLHPAHTDLHPAHTDLHPTHSVPGSWGQQTHFPIPICPPSHRLMEEEVMAPPCDESILQGDFLEEVEVAQLDNRDDAGSGYERRDNILVEMDTGDMVEGYK